MFQMPNACVTPSFRSTCSQGPFVNRSRVSETGIPSVLCIRLRKYPDHDALTVTDPKAYSRIRSQPMIHAMNSPIVA